jgi:ubiquinone/menaquinone biosynthesis C-methylase UbiE
VELHEAWDAQADEWARFARDPRGDRTNLEFNLPRFLELVPPAGRATLDVGCGEGRVGAALAERGHRVVGIDRSPGMVQHARERHEAHVADAAALPFADRSFDLVTAFMSLQDIEDLPGAVREAARVLEPGGRLCFAIVHPINSAGGFTSMEADAPFVIAGSYFVERRFDDLVERDGFRIVFAQKHRPLEAYARALENAGLAIEALREPAHPNSPRWSRVPLFLHVRAVKR